MPCYYLCLFPSVKVQPVNSSKTTDIIGRTILSIIATKLLLTENIIYIKATDVLIDSIILAISHQQSLLT